MGCTCGPNHFDFSVKRPSPFARVSTATDDFHLLNGSSSLTDLRFEL